jgi:hypothetical protein
MVTDEEKLFHVLDQTRALLVRRQQMHEASAKTAGTSGRKIEGARARECSTILQEMYKIIEEYSEK